MSSPFPMRSLQSEHTKEVACMRAELQRLERKCNGLLSLSPVCLSPCVFAREKLVSEEGKGGRETLFSLGADVFL
jgi:hypothetical protein